MSCPHEYIEMPFTVTLTLKSATNVVLARPACAKKYLAEISPLKTYETITKQRTVKPVRIPMTDGAIEEHFALSSKLAKQEAPRANATAYPTDSDIFIAKPRIVLPDRTAYIGSAYPT
jgi:hypothetical protein